MRDEMLAWPDGEAGPSELAAWRAHDRWHKRVSTLLGPRTRITSICTDQTLGTEPSLCTVGSITSCLLWRRGRKIPSFCILWISVVRFTPSLAAAPAAPPITQPTASNVRRISSRSASLNVVGGPKLACLEV